MIDAVKALVVVLAFSGSVFLLCQFNRQFLVARPQDLLVRQICWLSITSALFLSGDFWIFLLFSTIILLYAVSRDTNPLALYALLLMVAPPLRVKVPGFGMLNFLFDIDILRLLSILVICSVIPRIGSAKPQAVDYFVATYILIGLFILFTGDVFTSALRGSFYLVLDIALPYAVASRVVKNRTQLLEVIEAFCLGAIIIALIAVFETIKGWLLYGSVERFLQVPWAYSNYMRREDFLRASASLGHPIVMSYLLTIGFLFWFALKDQFKKIPVLWWLGLISLFAGSIAGFSRGPVVGLVAGGLLLGATAAVRYLENLRVLAFLGLAVLGVLSSSLWDIIKPYVPFVGSVDAFNVDYRERLIENSIELIKMSPWFGVPGFYSRLADMGMVQGEGIVDVVNTYIGIALAWGVPACITFALVFLVLMLQILKIRIQAGQQANQAQYVALGASLLGALGATMVTLGTTSSILAIPAVYWLVVGIAVSFLRISSSPVSDRLQQVENDYRSLR